MTRVRRVAPSPASPPGVRQRGYTLIEVIVAFAVLALALTLLLGTLSGGVRQVRQSADGGRAALHAQSLLADIGVSEVLQPGHREGELDGGVYRWQLDVQPFVDNQRPPEIVEGVGAPRLLELQLTLQWGEGGPAQRLQVRTLRLVQPDAGGMSL
jgi:general secretion pathway protein I